jgi:hypothetical protein
MCQGVAWSRRRGCSCAALLVHTSIHLAAASGCGQLFASTLVRRGPRYASGGPRLHFSVPFSQSQAVKRNDIAFHVQQGDSGNSMRTAKAGFGSGQACDEAPAEQFPRSGFAAPCQGADGGIDRGCKEGGVTRCRLC